MDLYTPVNEPLTTARFSALYGHWHPHLRDGLAFARAVLSQCRAVVLSMRTIRRVRPDARLIQTEDLGKTHSRPALRYQADFENEHRWLTFDLLTGKVDRQHPMNGYFLYLGVGESELRWFQDNPCPPDLLGINHYLTSERFLDERLDRYPARLHGGNGRHSYADVEAVRVHTLDGPAVLLGEVWVRYRLPLAVTEVHLACTREEQLRWLLEVWLAASRLRDAGADVRAVTAWSLLGAFDWDSLVTLPRGRYEPGAFDVRSGRPRPTALARMVQDLATGKEPRCPILETPGWWRRPGRIHYLSEIKTDSAAPRPSSRSLLVVGGGGLSEALSHVCSVRGLSCTILPANDRDLRDQAAVGTILAEHHPWAAIHTGGSSDPAVLCAWDGLPLLMFSPDVVGEGLPACSQPNSLIVRYGPTVDLIDMVNASLDLLIDGARGTWNFAGAGRRRLQPGPGRRPRRDFACQGVNLLSFGNSGMSAISSRMTSPDRKISNRSIATATTLAVKPPRTPTAPNVAQRRRRGIDHAEAGDHHRHQKEQNRQTDAHRGNLEKADASSVGGDLFEQAFPARAPGTLPQFAGQARSRSNRWIYLALKPPMRMAPTRMKMTVAPATPSKSCNL